MEELKCADMDEPIVTAELAEPVGAIEPSRRLIFSSGVKLGLVIAIVALAGNEALYYFVPRVDPGFGHWVPLTNQIIYLCVLVWLTASLALASIWLGIGKWPLLCAISHCFGGVRRRTDFRAQIFDFWGGLVVPGIRRLRA